MFSSDRFLAFEGRGEGWDGWVGSPPSSESVWHGHGVGTVEKAAAVLSSCNKKRTVTVRRPPHETRCPFADRSCGFVSSIHSVLHDHLSSPYQCSYFSSLDLPRSLAAKKTTKQLARGQVLNVNKIKYLPNIPVSPPTYAAGSSPCQPGTVFQPSPPP